VFKIGTAKARRYGLEVLLVAFVDKLALIAVNTALTSLVRLVERLALMTDELRSW
jgi:hypothetical protein